MTNALNELNQELQEINKSKEDILKIAIKFDKSYFDYKNIDSLEEMDFMYDDGYGGQELFGVVLFKDGSWLERLEYDGSEWWVYRKKPTEENLDYWMKLNDVDLAHPLNGMLGETK